MGNPRVARSNVIAAFFEKTNRVQWLDAILQYEVKPCDLLLVVPIQGDALTSDGIIDGDMVVARMNYSVEEITPGKLVLAMTSHGLLVLHAYITLEGAARFAPSNLDCESHTFRCGTFKILGVVVEVLHQLEI